MTTTAALTRDIGQAERTLRALLERTLNDSGLSFSDWTVLVFLDDAGLLAGSELIQRQVDGRVAPEAAARTTVDGLRASGLIATADETDGPAARSTEGEDPLLTLTPAGQSVYQPVRQSVLRIMGEIYGDLPAADLEATHRTLAEVARRAHELLAPTRSMNVSTAP